VEAVAEGRVVNSVGSRRQLAALRRAFRARRLHGVSIHRRLLDARTVADLRDRADLVLSWPVATPEEACLLAGWGVDGLITEAFETLSVALRVGVGATRSPARPAGAAA
jgi:glycerophosphoryl diester phosphodiesterase